MLRRLLKDTGAVAVGTGIGQGVMLLATPFLARQYSPADFGTLALLMTVGNISTVVACLRYDMAIPSARAEDARGLFITAAAAAGVLGGLAYLLAGALWAAKVLPEGAAHLLERPALVGACVALAGTYQATAALLLRRGRYGGVAGLRLAQGAASGLLPFLPGMGLLWGYAASFAGGLVGAWRSLGRRSPGSTSWHEVALRYRSFPLVNLPGAVLDVVGYSTSVWVIATSYGSSAAGEYSQVQRLIGAPLMLLSMSLGQIMLRHTADLAHDLPTMRALLVRLLRIMAVGAAAGLLFLWAAGRQGLMLLLGPQWRIETETIVALGAAVFVRASVSPLSAALLTLRRLDLILGWQAAYFCSAIALMPWVAGRLTLRGYVRFYAVHELVFYGAYLGLIFLAVRIDPCAESSAS